VNEEDTTKVHTESECPLIVVKSYKEGLKKSFAGKKSFKFLFKRKNKQPEDFYRGSEKV